jgi:hypothetical protein
MNEMALSMKMMMACMQVVRVENLNVFVLMIPYNLKIEHHEERWSFE